MLFVRFFGTAEAHLFGHHFARSTRGCHLQLLLFSVALKMLESDETEIHPDVLLEVHHQEAESARRAMQASMALAEKSGALLGLTTVASL